MSTYIICNKFIVLFESLKKLLIRIVKNMDGAPFAIHGRQSLPGAFHRAPSTIHGRRGLPGVLGQWSS